VCADPDRDAERYAPSECEDRKIFHERAIRDADKNAKSEVNGVRGPDRCRRVRKHRDQEHRFGNPTDAAWWPRDFPTELEPRTEEASDRSGQHSSGRMSAMRMNQRSACVRSQSVAPHDSVSEPRRARAKRTARKSARISLITPMREMSERKAVIAVTSLAGWVADRESSELARLLLSQTIERRRASR